MNWPVIATDRFRWLGWLVFGLTRVSKGVPLTVNPLVSVTISAFVVSVTQEQTGSVSSNTQSLFEAVRRGEGSRIRTAIEAGVDVNRGLDESWKPMGTFRLWLEGQGGFSEGWERAGKGVCVGS